MSDQRERKTDRLTLGAMFVAVLAIGLALGSLTSTHEYPRCYEDSVLMWDGETDAHTRCIPLDNLTTTERTETR